MLIPTLIARFMGPTRGPSGADRTQVGPMLGPWTLLSGNTCKDEFILKWVLTSHYNNQKVMNFGSIALTFPVIGMIQWSTQYYIVLSSALFQRCRETTQYGNRLSVVICTATVGSFTIFFITVGLYKFEKINPESLEETVGFPPSWFPQHEFCISMRYTNCIMSYIVFSDKSAWGKDWSGAYLLQVYLQPSCWRIICGWPKVPWPTFPTPGRLRRINIKTHYRDVTMGAMASQITGVSIVCSTVCSGKSQSPASLTFVSGIHGRPADSPHKGPATRKTFPFDDAIMALS